MQVGKEYFAQILSLPFFSPNGCSHFEITSREKRFLADHRKMVLHDLSS
jgi:hypothetical protein